MVPIHVGIIGLSKTGWASSAHLPYLSSSSKYKIVAICNSSVQSARDAVELYKLPADTRAYGDAEGWKHLAKDPIVDPVVRSIRVDKQFPAIRLALNAGKNVFVEWPLGRNFEEAAELLKLSKAHGVKQTIVGLQGRFAPAVVPTDSESIRYMMDKSIGGNLLTIHFAHAIDFIQEDETASGIIANRRAVIQLLNRDGTITVKDYSKTSDDTVFVHGIASNDAPVSVNFRGGKAFQGTPGQDWRIYGEKGEIRLTASGSFLQIGYPDIKIAIHDFANNDVEEVKFDEDPFDGLPLPARNVARSYEAIADGDSELLCSFENAVERYRLIESLYKANKN